MICAVVIMPLLAHAADGDIPLDQLLAQVLDLVKSFGGLPWMGKISAIVLLLLASMKVSFLRPLWDKLGRGKVLASLVMSLVVGICALGASGSLSIPGVMAYLFAGAGAIILHELLDWIKSIPGLGAMYVAAINFLMGLLGGKSS